ncbi:hypothetical protein LWI28_017349 [Acer negundo]|uniref:Uncharacterized protein n=1 Tax=Acer negundo TaxID=4023 RepID=A0AAD5IN18_ACENE|nr:hypothetical protein LWI28_017349 [Acer negundo]
MSAWPGRLSLTNSALYFESLGVGVYEKAVRYDLATDMKQVIKPELTGPLGARLFDKAVMYKSTSVPEPVYFEFPEFKGNSRRDYWLDICLEILRAHRFINKHNFNKIQQSEVLGKAILGIFRYRAVREAFNIFSSQYKTLLAFNLAESLPRGDTILQTLSSRLALLNIGGAQHDMVGSPPAKQKQKLSPLEIFVGETNPLEIAVKQSISDTGRAEAAQATVDQVKVEGIDTNAAVMKELLFPVIVVASRLQLLASWKEPFKSTVFLVLSSYAILRGWIVYVLPSIFVFLAVLMLWRKLLFAVVPPATDKVALLLVFLAAVIVFVPLRVTILFVYLEAYTRELPYRKESSDKLLRRVREWWIKIPAAPVQLIKADDKKKKKR